MDWAFVWLMVVLKVPLGAALWIVWWSIRAEPASTEDDATDGGGSGGGEDHPRPRRPRPPRRGPHAEPAARSPRRVRAHAPRAMPARR